MQSLACNCRPFCKMQLLSPSLRSQGRPHIWLPDLDEVTREEMLKRQMESRHGVLAMSSTPVPFSLEAILCSLVAWATRGGSKEKEALWECQYLAAQGMQEEKRKGSKVRCLGVGDEESLGRGYPQLQGKADPMSYCYPGSASQGLPSP